MANEFERSNEEQESAANGNDGNPGIRGRPSSSTNANRHEHKEDTSAARQKVYAACKSAAARVWLHFPKSGDVWMAGATVIMAVAMIVYTAYTRMQWNTLSGQLEQMIGASAQTDRLLILNTGQLAQSRTMATELAKQAKATNDLAAQAKRQADAAHDAIAATAELAREDRRPWVGLRDFRYNNCTSAADGSLTIGGILGVIENTGKTPAIEMIVNAAFTGGLKASEPIPDYDSVQRQERSINSYKIPSRLPPDEAARIAKSMNILKRFAEPPAMVLPPNAIHTLPVLGGLVLNLVRKTQANIEDRTIFYVVGKITYHSTWKDKEHTTKFCLMSQFDVAFQFCPNGNSME